MNDFESTEKEFRLLDDIPLGAFILRRDFVVLYWNSCVEDWTGIPRTKIIGKNITTYFPHMNNSKYLSRLQNIFNGGPPTIFSSQLHKFIIPSKLWDGQMRIQHTTVTSVKAGNATDFHALFAIQDVTDLTYRIQGYRTMRDQALEEIKERAHAEEKLLKAREELELRVKERTADLVLVNEKLKQEITEREKAGEELKKLISTLNTLVDHMPEGVILLDAGHRVMLANSIGENYLKAISNAAIGDLLSDLAGAPLTNFLASEPHKTWHEIEIQGPPQKIFELAGKTISQNNIISGMVLVLKDVTEERMLEERIHVQERLAAVGQMAAGIAHDFNNILTGIIGFSDLLLTDSLLNKEDRHIAKAILQNGERAAQLIRQILDFSRKSISEMKSVDLKAFLREFSKFITRTIPENIDIALNIDPGEHIVIADPAKIQQVLANLAVNARDAMPKGGKLTFALSRIAVSPSDMPPVPEMSPGNWITLTVSDTGTGITSEILPHIFEPFFTTKDVGKGTGLGLSQVYGIIKQHEGHIAVETKAGIGSTFVLYLPESKVMAELLHEGDEVFLPMHQEETVLVVEDNESVRNLISRMLSKLNLKVLTARNGKEALALFKTHNGEIKLLITDLVMPEMGGMELSRMLKSANPAIKVIALSGYPLGSETEDFLDAGIEKCIQKPFQGKTLVQAVYNILQKDKD